MSDIAKLRKIFEQQNNVSKNIAGVGIISMRLPTAHERQMAWSQAMALCGMRDPSGCVIAAKRELSALCLMAWSVTPRLLLAERAPQEGADDVMAVDAEAAKLFFDRFPEHYEALSGELMTAISEREKAQQEAEKNS